MAGQGQRWLPDAMHWTPAGVTATRCNGTIHDFGLLNPLAHISGADSAMLQAGAELKKHLQ
ncbi:hypothetical protein SAMN05216603_110144 [Pseudomonas benzenivorans]|nr:hypothetical protein SAMN05216603_110144 [Pseudomonas benzenivorans]